MSALRIISVCPSERMPDGDRMVLWVYLVDNDPKPRTNSAFESELQAVMDGLKPKLQEWRCEYPCERSFHIEPQGHEPVACPFCGGDSVGKAAP